MPIPVGPIGHSVEYSPGALLMREKAHGSGSPSHFPEFPLQVVGGADLLPQFFGEGVLVQAVVEILFHAPYCSFFFHLPFLLPRLESSYGLPAAIGIEDLPGLSHAGPHMHPFQFGGYVPQFVNRIPLHLEEGIDLSCGFKQGLMAISGNKPQSPCP